MMEYYSFVPSMVPLGPIMGLIAKALRVGIFILVGYVVSHYIMRGLGALWRRR